MNLSLYSLVQSLISKGAKVAQEAPMDASAPNPTSIRLKPATKHFLDCQAEALNTSTQSLIAMILDGVAEASTNKTASALRSMRERFFYLFEAHGVNMPQIVSILSHRGFTLSALNDQNRLLDLLTHENIVYISSLFSIDPQWLSGRSDSRVTHGSVQKWYKEVYNTARKLLEYSALGLSPCVIFIRQSRAKFREAHAKNDNTATEPIGFAVRLKKTTNDGVEYFVYQMFEFERWNYSRCRSEYKLLIAFCTEAFNFVSYDSCEIERESLERLVRGEVVPASILHNSMSERWRPEDYANIRYSVQQEQEDWPAVRAEYDREGYSKLISNFSRQRTEIRQRLLQGEVPRWHWDHPCDVAVEGGV